MIWSIGRLVNLPIIGTLAYRLALHKIMSLGAPAMDLCGCAKQSLFGGRFARPPFAETRDDFKLLVLRNINYCLIEN